MSSFRVLVVDDEPAMLRTVVRVLERDFKVHGFSSPLAALEAAGKLKPDLAVVDIRMAEMDGFELMNALIGLDSHLRVILMTGSAFDTDKKLIRAIREKAFFYLHKPFERAVLRTLVDRCRELKTLEEENRRYLEHLESQLAEARAFQQTMLPARRAEIDGIEIHASYEPCTELAGDLYDYAPAGGGRVALLIADVVGHGASAAMLTSQVKSAFQASYPDYHPQAVVERVAETFASFEPGLFVTLFCARLSAPDGRLEYVNAGHDGGLLALPGHPAERLLPTGPLITAILSDARWQLASLDWPRDARLLLYTDGIPETWNESEKMYEIERLCAAVNATDASGAKLLAAIEQDVEAFAGGRPADDDKTLLTARLTADEQ